MPWARTVIWVQPCRRREGDDREGYADLSAGGHCEQEWKFTAGCRAGGGWDDSAGANGSVGGAGSMAEGEWRGYLRDAAVDEGGRGDQRTDEGAIHEEDIGGICGDSWRAEFEDAGAARRGGEGRSENFASGYEWGTEVEAECGRSRDRDAGRGVAVEVCGDGQDGGDGVA